MGTPEIGILFFFMLPWVLTIFLLVDVLRHSDATFVAAGESRTLWIVLAIVGFFFCPVTLVSLVVWLTTTRPRLTRATKSGRA